MGEYLLHTNSTLRLLGRLVTCGVYNNRSAVVESFHTFQPQYDRVNRPIIAKFNNVKINDCVIIRSSSHIGILNFNIVLKSQPPTSNGV